MLGIAFDRSGNADDAEKEWHEAARLRPDMVAAHEAMAKLALRTGNLDLLTGAAEQLIKSQPSLPTAIYFEQAQKPPGSSRIKPKPISQLLFVLRRSRVRATSRLRSLDFPSGSSIEAVANFQLALDREPDSAEALAGLAQAYVTLKQPVKAIAAVNAQIAKYPSNSGFYYTFGELQLGNHELSAANASFQKAIELNSGNLPALFQLGRLDMAQGDLR